MKIIRILIPAVCISLITACASTPTVKTKPALIIPSIESTSKLEAVMSKALNGRKVSLSHTAFTKSHTHVLQQRPAMTREGQLINGRMLGIPKPDRFALYKQGDSCYLIYEKTAAHYPLQSVQCR